MSRLMPLPERERRAVIARERARRDPDAAAASMAHARSFSTTPEAIEKRRISRRRRAARQLNLLPTQYDEARELAKKLCISTAKAADILFPGRAAPGRLYSVPR